MKCKNCLLIVVYFKEGFVMIILEKLKENIMTYNEMSRKVGYLGSIPFPSKDQVETLCQNLMLEPDITTYIEALSIYRFAPVAENDEQRMIIVKLGRTLRWSKRLIWGFNDEKFMGKVEVDFLKNQGYDKK